MLGSLGAESRTAEDQHRAMNGDGRFHFRDALFGQPGILLLEQGLELAGELSVIQLAGAVAAELAIQSLGQAGQHDIHQFFAHGSPQDGVFSRPQTARRPDN